MNNAKPMLCIRAGAIAVSVWMNEVDGIIEGEKKQIPSIKIKRNYKDGAGNWKETDYYNIQDLPKLMHAIDAVYNRFVLKEVPVQGEGPAQVDAATLTPEETIM
jgi:hypothetical protein